MFLFYLLLTFLLLYKSTRGFNFDFDLFWYNRSFVPLVLYKLFSYKFIFILLVLSLLIFSYLKFIIKKILLISKRNPKKYLIFFTCVLVFSFSSQMFSFNSSRETFVDFIYKNFFLTNKATTHYQKLYNDHLHERINTTLSLDTNIDISLLGESIFLLKLESINAFLANEKNTPNLFKIAQDGIFFPKLYSSSIYSIRAMESTLCGTPPSAHETLVVDLSKEDLNSLNCLPSILAKFGYKSLYFEGGDNPLTKDFATSIGFEYHFKDIMEKGDPEFPWGFREDIFFKRVIEYLEKFKKEKIFVVIDIGTTNHFPFTTYNQDLRFINSIPFPSGKGLVENLANSTYVQDKYFEMFYNKYQQEYESSSLILMGDHSWPIGIHKNNFFNEAGAYEENFLTSLLFIPPKNQQGNFSVNKSSNNRFSLSDIAPTILDLLKNNNNSLFLGESFAHELLIKKHSENKLTKTKFSIQPYDGGWISLVDFPNKYLFNNSDKVSIFNLETDPYEQNPIFEDSIHYLHLIDEYFEQ